MRHGNGRNRKSAWIIGTLVLSCAWSLLMAAGYGVSVLLFRITGRPSAIWITITAGFIGMLLFTVGSRIYAGVHRRRRFGDGRLAQMRNTYLQSALEGMDRIAHGDFSVLIPVDEHNPFSELAESVNKMARELGSMENLRQDFISNVSHEIQSPLTSIAGFAELLKSDTLGAEQRGHYIHIIETEAGRLSKLSENLMKLSTLESSEQPLTVTAFSLDKQIQNAILMLEPQWAEKNIEIVLSLEKTVCSGDEGLLTQVWINLLHNAVKFTPEQGEIGVTLEKDEKMAVCRISDTGIGISEEDRMHIFERFYKADKARSRALGGSGLGLSLVKKIVELHGGIVDAESQLGKGSVFTVKLPLKS